MMEAPNSNNSKDGHLERQTELADIVNKSSHSFYRLKQAEEQFESARRDFRKSKSESAAFPAALDRAQTKVDAARKTYNKAVEENRGATNSLNSFLQTLSVLAQQVPLPGEAASSNIVAAGDIEEQCKRIIASQISDLKTQNENMKTAFESQISMLKQELDVRASENRSLFKALQDRQEENSITINSLSSSIHDLKSSLQDFNKDMKVVDERVTGLTLQLAPNSAGVDKLSYLDHEVGDLNARVTQNREALRKAEKAFDLIYERLERAEKNLDPNKATETSELTQALRNRVEVLESNLSGISETSEQHSKDLSNVRKIEDSHHILEAQISSQTNMIDSHSITLLELGRSAEKVAELEKSLEEFGKQLGLAFNSISKNNAAPPLPENYQQHLDSLQERVIHVEKQWSETMEQVNGFVMAMRHLSKKVDDVSTDEIVMKVNMSLRNASPRYVQSLNSQIQNLTSGIEKVELLEKRVLAVEQTALLPSTEFTNSLALGAG